MWSIQKLLAELGIPALLKSPRDTHLILLTRTLRMLAYGSSTLILALYFSALGHSDAAIGLFMSLTLVGDVLISLLLTLYADNLGRRRTLQIGCLSMAVSGAVFAIFSNYWILLFAAVVGVISPSGNEIGPFRAVEESTIAHLTEANDRSDIFAWYVVFGTLGTAAGSLGGGWMVQSLQSKGWDIVTAYRMVFWVYAIVGFTKAGITFLLSDKCEPQPVHQPLADHVSTGEESEAFLGPEGQNAHATLAPPPPKKQKWAIASISRSSQITLVKLCGLFFFDSLASGMVAMSLISFYMERKFNMPSSRLGTIVSIASFMSSLGNIFASSISKRIGLVKTMVFTHLPSAIFLALIPAPTSLVPTVILLVARATLASMDQAPRSAFLSAIVLPSERTAVMGIVNTVKTMSQSSGPLITGLLAGRDRFWVAFLIAGSLKASYDMGMLTMFVNMPLDKRNGKGAAEEQQRNQPPVELQDAEEFEVGSDADDEDSEDGHSDKKDAKSTMISPV